MKWFKLILIIIIIIFAINLFIWFNLKPKDSSENIQDIDTTEEIQN